MNRARNGHLSGTQPPEMSWERLDRLDWHLWVLAVLLIFVLGASLLSFMFPSTFWLGEESAIPRPQRAFFGFCVLLALVLVYLLQRQATIRKLKRQLFQSQAEAIATRREAAIQSFQTLPGMSQFRDTLAMEFRRASTSDSSLAVVLLTVPNAAREGLGYISNALRSLLRQGESLYRLSDTGIAIILPGMELNKAASFATQAEGSIGLPKGELEITVTAYPDQVESLAELEQRLRSPGSAPLSDL